MFAEPFILGATSRDLPSYKVAYLAAMLRPTIDASAPERIVMVYTGTGQDRRMAFSFPELADLRQRQDAVTDLVGTSRFGASISDGERSSFAWAGLVTGNYFSFFNTRPALGRLLQPSDDRPGAPAVMVLSHRFWMGALGGDPSVVGRELRVNGTGVTVVGVADKDFEGMNFASALYVPTLLTDRLTAVSRVENRDGLPLAEDPLAEDRRGLAAGEAGLAHPDGGVVEQDPPRAHGSSSWLGR